MYRGYKTPRNQAKYRRRPTTVSENETRTANTLKALGRKKKLETK